MKRSRLGIRRRIVLALAALVLLVAAAAVLAVSAHQSLHDELEHAAAAERQSRAALVLSLAVRDMYAHQAHTIILDDRSHLGHYAESHTQVMALIDVMNGLLASSPHHAATDRSSAVHTAPDHTALDHVAMDRVAADAAALERNFRDAIVPAIGGPRDALVAPHDRALALVEDITAQIDGLTARFRRRAEEAERRAEIGNARELAWHIALTATGALFAAAVGFYLTRSLARPISDLESAASRLATGDLSARIVPPADADFGALATAFNSMASDLQTHQDRLVTSEKLASVGRIAAGIAHEINNPLAVILGHAHLLRRSPDARVADDARRIQAEAERCQAIVQGLLDLSRPTRLALTEVDLADLVQEVADSLATTDLACTITVEGVPTRVSADARKVRQILVNLVRNAAESAPRSAIRVQFVSAATHVAIRVSDEGPGVDPAMRDQVFEPFHTTKSHGTGLGLAVSRALATAHGGTLSVDPTPVSTFVLTLPIHPIKPTEAS